MIKILIVDDHPIVSQGLKQILAKEPDILVGGEARNAKEVFSLTRKENWDVVVLDLTLPDRSGMEVLKQLKAEHSLLPVLILTMHSEEQYAVRA